MRESEWRRTSRTPPSAIAWPPFKTTLSSACFIRSESILAMTGWWGNRLETRTLRVSSSAEASIRTLETTFLKVLLLELQFDRAGEIDQGLHYPVEAVDLALNDVQMAQRAFIGAVELVTEQLQVHHDRIDRILDLVTNAGGQPADGRETARELQLTLDLPDRFEVVQGQERAEGLTAVGRAVVVDEVERNLYPPAGLGSDLFLHDRDAGVEGVADGGAEPGGAIEDLVKLRSQDLSAAQAKEPFDRIADQHGAGVAGEEQDAVFQIGHDLVEVFFQGGKDLLHVAHAAAKALDLVGDLHDRVIGGVGVEFADGFRLGEGVETLADLGQRPKGEVGQECRNQQGAGDGDAGKGQSDRTIAAESNYSGSCCESLSVR